MGEVDELGGAAIFLVSDASSFMTGQIIYIEGDMTRTRMSATVAVGRMEDRSASGPPCKRQGSSFARSYLHR
ncbi:hypothetical protein [Mesorhizobium sp. M0664]|uniref:hypothetical protein n=1 Tax=unclassified Mesorhizobium TaxID=325217 RepID=UPI003337FEB0